jgi:ferritin-like protein
MASDNLHAPRDRLRKETIHMHQAITSLMEELEAVDWYQQRADDCDDPSLKAILLHNMKEEIEHAAMALEWLRRASPDFDKELKEYLFTEGDIVEQEQAATGPGDEKDTK